MSLSAPSPDSPLFQQVLGEVTHLAEAGDASVVFVVPGRKNRYVQLSFSDGFLAAESVGNEYLDSTEQLSPDDEKLLDALEWNPPDTDHAGNFWKEWRHPLPYVEVAALLTQTLLVIHDAPATAVQVNRI
jgi:hypothetical protein